MFALTIRQHVIGGLKQRVVGFGEGGVDNGQFVGVGADHGEVTAFGDEAAGGSGETVTHAFLHGPVLPQGAASCSLGSLLPFAAAERGACCRTSTSSSNET